MRVLRLHYLHGHGDHCTFRFDLYALMVDRDTANGHFGCMGFQWALEDGPTQQIAGETAARYICSAAYPVLEAAGELQAAQQVGECEQSAFATETPVRRVLSWRLHNPA